MNKKESKIVIGLNFKWALKANTSSGYAPTVCALI